MLRTFFSASSPCWTAWEATFQPTSTSTSSTPSTARILSSSAPAIAARCPAAGKPRVTPTLTRPASISIDLIAFALLRSVST